MPSVTLAWDPSPDDTLDGYNIYYGVASGAYTNSLFVGNVTNATISELIPGTTYFFAATALDLSGLESVFSNEVSYTVPAGVGRLGVQLAQGGQVEIAAAARPGDRYQVLGSSDLVQWDVIGMAISGPGGVLRFSDPAQATNAVRYYRMTQLSPPPHPGGP